MSCVERRRHVSDVVTIRPASAADERLLQRMLAVAADWRPGSTARSLDDVLADAELAHYVIGWPRAGDFGFVAQDDDRRPVGAAWCRSFSADDPGYGFVSPDVPEISIGVVADLRGRGIGRRLLVALVDEARSRGVEQVGLSVELDNPAMGLYSSLGFVVVAEAQGAATMVRSLA